ncbi:MAG TPA: hypothetical protein VFJ58_25665 [Armatimonadota bacterium]|nr:hypothetical protein [Armatimonadota bacterium]
MSPTDTESGRVSETPVEPKYTTPIRRRNAGLFFFVTIALLAFAVWMIFLMFNEFGKPIGFIR